MTEAQIKRALDLTGWELVYDMEQEEYNAEQGSFVTPWRKTPDQVLADVRAMSEPDPHEGRNESDPRLEDR